MSVLGESRGRRIKEEARLGARRVILASQAWFIVFYFGFKGKYIKP